MVIRWARGLVLSCLVGLCPLATSVAAQERKEAILLPQPLPNEIDRIELVWFGDAEPTVLINQLEPPPRHAERLRGSEVRLIPAVEQLRPFGSCHVSWLVRGEELVIQFEGMAEAACGVVWFLGQPEETVDVLSFHALRFVGRSSGAIELGVADRAWWSRQDHVSCVTVSGPFEADVSLARLIDLVDLRELVALTITAVELPAELTITKAWVEAAPMERPGPMGRGLWVWDLQKAARHADQVVETCRSIGCRRLSIQVPSAGDSPSVWRAFCSLVRRWRAEGIEVLALDGYPEAAVNPDRLLAGIRRLMAECGESPPDGFQVDIEPYLLPEARLGQDRYRDYLTSLVQIRHMLPPDVPLSVVVPFWFPEVSVEGRPLALGVVQVADEVVVMSYRVAVVEAQTLMDDWGRYGALLGKPVWGAMETRPLPDEQHLLLRRVARLEEASAYVDRSTGRLVLAAPRSAKGDLVSFTETARYQVQGHQLSFAGRSKKAVKKAITDWARTDQLAVTGVMIHDWEGYEQLP
ncbi:MAG: hypothetical protein NNA31_10910 [Nitrospira sp.]|nr:hypothetical protein [Nitrospira sp.]